MPPTLYVIRHGQGEHNVNDQSHLKDPLLTDTGKAQCKSLQEHFPFLQDVQAIVVSPLRRTIQTAAFVFAPELEKRQLPIILAPDAQEISHLACDLGYDADVIKSHAPNLIAKAVPSYNAINLDATLVDESWNLKKGINAPTLSAVRSRASRLRNWIYNRPEKHIALVTHGGFLHYLTEDWNGYEKANGTGYRNCEYRKLVFTECSNGENSHLQEYGSMLGKQERPVRLYSSGFDEIEQAENASA